MEYDILLDVENSIQSLLNELESGRVSSLCEVKKTLGEILDYLNRFWECGGDDE